MSTLIQITKPTELIVNNTPIIGGVAGRVLFQGTGDILQQSANISWDNTNVAFFLGSVATRTLIFRPQATSGAFGNSSLIGGGNGNGRLDFYSATNITQLTDNVVVLTSVGGPSIQVGVSSIALNVAGATQLAVAATTGNIVIGGGADAGFRLDVNGTARVSDNLLLTNGIIATSTATTRLQGSLNYFTHNRIASSGVFGFQIATFGTVTSFWRWDGATYDIELGSPSGALSQNFKLFTAGSERMRLSAGGNILINTTTDAGFRLDVNGTARVSGSELRVGNLQLLTSGSPGATGQGITTIGRKISLQSQGEINIDNAAAYQFLGYADSPVSMVQNATGRTVSFVQVKGGFSAPNYANTQGNVLWMNPVYNMQGTSNAGQILRGIYYNPTLTDLTNAIHFAIHTTSGRIRFEGLPTSSAGLSAGEIWNDGGTIRIV
jgi:hypothetical protein